MEQTATGTVIAYAYAYAYADVSRMIGQSSARRTKRYTPEDWARYKARAADIGTRLAGHMRAGLPVGDPQVQAGVEAHRLLIDTWFYPCPVQMHEALGQMYVSDPRFREISTSSATATRST